jgi:hypothetical protein
MSSALFSSVLSLPLVVVGGAKRIVLSSFLVPERFHRLPKDFRPLSSRLLLLRSTPQGNHLSMMRLKVTPYHTGPTTI